MAKEPVEFSGLDRFDRVEATGETAMFLAFLDRVDALPHTKKRRHRSYSRLAIGSGAVVADIGCGPGTAARELAALVGPQGRVLGVDLSASFVDEARRRAAAAKITNAAFDVADACTLPMADAELDAYRAERLFQHLAQPDLALVEAFRVLRPGGRMLVLDQDWDATLVDGDIPTTRQITRAFADSLVNANVARRLRVLARAVGFTDVEVIPEAQVMTDGAAMLWFADTMARSAEAAGVDADRVRAWVDDQHRRASEDCFMISMTFLSTTARRP